MAAERAKKSSSGPKISLKALQWRLGELKKQVRNYRDTVFAAESMDNPHVDRLNGYLKALDDVLKLVRKMPKE
jgi:hypothetical protein